MTATKTTPRKARGRRKPIARVNGQPAAVRTAERFSSAAPPGNVADLSDQVVLLPISSIDPHPQNPGRGRITAENTQALAGDIDAHGLQQPIKVRPHGVSGRYQIIFGERRYRACAELKRQTIEAFVCDVDDRTALTLQAVENGQREDVDPMAVAGHLAALVAVQHDGSPGLTQAEAGRCYGITQGEVANRIRLLRLPEAWQQLVISGDITPKKARLLVPYAEATQLLAELSKAYHSDRWVKGYWRHDSEVELGDWLDRQVKQLTRPVDKRTKHDYRWPDGAHPRYFEISDATRNKLDIVELPLGKRPKKGAARVLVERAQNAKLWDKLNRAGVKAAVAKGKQGKSSGRSSSAQDLSPAQQAAHKRKAREKRRLQLREDCAAWKLRMLRLCISEVVQAGDWRTNLAATICFDAWCHARAEQTLEEIVNVATDEISGTVSRPVVAEHYSSDNSRLLAKLLQVARDDGDELHASERVLAGVVRLTLWPVSVICGDFGSWLHHVPPAWKETLPPLSPGVIEMLAELWQVRVADGWKAGAGKGPQRDLVKQFLQLHRKAELLELAAELGVTVDAAGKHADIVDAVLTAHASSPAKKPLKLPKCFADPKPRKKKGR